MYTPPPDPRDPQHHEDYTWTGVALTIVATGLVPFALWSFHRPVAAALLVAAAVGLAAVAGRTLGLARCLRDCGGFVVDVGDRLQVCVVRPGASTDCSTP